MDRRDFLPKALLLSAAATGGALATANAQAQTCAVPCYPKTNAEPYADAEINTAVPSYEACGESLPERFLVGSPTAANVTLACQRAINVAPEGGVVRFSRSYTINDALTINKALTLLGNGYPNPYGSTTQGYIRQQTTSKNVFTLVPTLQGYAFNHPGIVGVRFQNLAICGYGDGASRCARGIGVKTDVAGRHVRHVHITDCSFKHCNIAVDLDGIAYLNHFNNVLISSCGTGVRVANGNAGDNGGQTRFFGCQIVMNTGACFDCTENVGGDFAFFGCTMSHSRYGIKAHEETLLTVIGCTFEDNKLDGGAWHDSAAIYINIADSANPNTETTRTILGNKFLYNSTDIYFHKTTTSFSTGWRYPTLIDGNTFLGVLRFDPSANEGTIVLGAANGGTAPGGTLALNQVQDFADTNARALQSARSVSWRGTGAGDQIIAAYDVPPGSTIRLLNLDRCTINPLTGARSHAGCALLDSSNTIVANFFGYGFDRAGAFWTNNSTTTTRTVRLAVNDNGYGTIISVCAQVYISSSNAV